MLYINLIQVGNDTCFPNVIPNNLKNIFQCNYSEYSRSRGGFDSKFSKTGRFRAAPGKDSCVF
jgi:hypothetical protein